MAHSVPLGEIYTELAKVGNVHAMGSLPTRYCKFSIGFPKMFRVSLGRNGTERFTVPRHENRDFLRRLSKM